MAGFAGAGSVGADFVDAIESGAMLPSQSREQEHSFVPARSDNPMEQAGRGNVAVDAQGHPLATGQPGAAPARTGAPAPAPSGMDPAFAARLDRNEQILATLLDRFMQAPTAPAPVVEAPKTPEGPKYRTIEERTPPDVWNGLPQETRNAIRLLDEQVRENFEQLAGRQTNVDLSPIEKRMEAFEKRAAEFEQNQFVAAYKPQAEAAKQRYGAELAPHYQAVFNTLRQMQAIKPGITIDQVVSIVAPNLYQAALGLDIAAQVRAEISRANSAGILFDGAAPGGQPTNLDFEDGESMERSMQKAAARLGAARNGGRARSNVGLF